MNFKIGDKIICKEVAPGLEFNKEYTVKSVIKEKITLIEVPDSEYYYMYRFDLVDKHIVKTLDNVNSPKHYTSHPSGIECIQVTEHMNFCIGNAIKYLWRSDLKNGVEDLKKAIWYINREIEFRNKQTIIKGATDGI